MLSNNFSQCLINTSNETSQWQVHTAALDRIALFQALIGRRQHALHEITIAQNPFVALLIDLLVS